MGQYWVAVNLDKKEFVNPHKLGSGSKLWEQLANSPGTGEALLILCAAMPETRGGGDFDLKNNWHGPERRFPQHNSKPGPMPKQYQTIAKRTIGRWAGDRIALVGDYAKDGDLAAKHKASTIYHKCYRDGQDGWTDVSDDVAAVIEHELHDLGKYTGTGGCREWKSKDGAA